MSPDINEKILAKVRKQARAAGRQVARQMVKDSARLSQQSYIIADPTPFTSAERLRDLLAVLSILRAELPTRTKWVLPSLLLRALQSLVENRKEGQLPTIVRKWLPSFYSDDHIRLICRGLTTDDEYLRAVREFLSTFKPVPASEFLANDDRIGGATIFRRRLHEEIGEVAGEVLFEVLGSARKLGALIISFGEQTYRLAAKFGEKIRKVGSGVKNNVKKRTRLRRALRIAGYVLSAESARSLITSLGLYIPGDVGMGILLVADG